MKKFIGIVYILFFHVTLFAQNLLTPCEKSAGKQTATYLECIDYYEHLDRLYNTISLKKFNTTDAGLPLHVIIYSAEGKYNVDDKSNKKIVVLINNGIHPGEPDGIDACMMLMRDLAAKKIAVPKNVVIACIAVYNIGGALNTNSNTRVNQNGPESYGFRGNSQNLDLNRDFIKNDAKESKAFAEIFHYFNPAIFVDNHVSDGADYQYTMTLLASQHDKMGGAMGEYMKNVFTPALYTQMKSRGEEMCPYVNFEDALPEKGFSAFYDPPRYSSGYASLFQTLAYVPETHMLKSFANRVSATYKLMQSVIAEADKRSQEILQKRKEGVAAQMKQTEFPVSWKIDSSRVDTIRFRGYETGMKLSEVTGKERLYYDRNKPYDRPATYYAYYKGTKVVTAPKAYIIPRGWGDVIERLKLNSVKMQELSIDTVMMVEVYRIEDYKSFAKPYEKHHKNYDIVTSTIVRQVQVRKGDFIVSTNQPAKRYLVEVLEPGAEDSFFAWNFFDAILQQKEGYSDYRWEDLAADFLRNHPEVRQQLEEKKANDKVFAESTSAQLYFVYRNSPYYESAHLTYPIYRLMK